MLYENVHDAITAQRIGDPISGRTTRRRPRLATTYRSGRSRPTGTL